MINADTFHLISFNEFLGLEGSKKCQIMKRTGIWKELSIAPYQL